ncbi:hypothetical protein DEU56DRAFT_902634 [Suillus clintonianus]|uniref:uncharacterized protein n=1 Tax=Suillus clintonianus TaxID=1904413 RepID=UPI001B85E413|nr:uncharacterized protein DEU56DRAFT_902634 [Suillus clintonianus]KAG2130696.1 hypothetical protein DEU56DRAFT_902634 [Suillus clintonianus]
MSALQGYQADVLLWSNYYYVALTSLWVYDFILCMTDSITFIVESRCGLGTVFYLACEFSPSAFLLLNMLGIFVLRMLAVWERERRFMVIKIINIIAYLVPILVFFYEFNVSAGECSIPGGIRYVDTKGRHSVIAVYCLLIAAELEILVCVLYRAFESHGGWRIENRLMRGLMHHNLLYFCCSFGSCPSHSIVYLLNGTAFSLGVVLATIYLPFPVVHVIAETQVVVLSLLVTRMHRDFWRSDRAACGIDGVDLSLTTFMAATPDVM